MTSSADLDTSNRPCVLGGLGYADFALTVTAREVHCMAREVMTFFFTDQHHFGLHHPIFGDCGPEKW